MDTKALAECLSYGEISLMKKKKENKKNKKKKRDYKLMRVLYPALIFRVQ